MEDAAANPENIYGRWTCVLAALSAALDFAGDTPAATA